MFMKLLSLHKEVSIKFWKSSDPDPPWRMSAFSEWINARSQ